jgi:hypothetical protein
MKNWFRRVILSAAKNLGSHLCPMGLPRFFAALRMTCEWPFFMAYPYFIISARGYRLSLEVGNSWRAATYRYAFSTRREDSAVSCYHVAPIALEAYVFVIILSRETLIYEEDYDSRPHHFKAVAALARCLDGTAGNDSI